MPKMKTHSGAKKRFKKLSSGLVKYWKKDRRHKLGKKTTKRKRQLRKPSYIADVDMSHIARLLPY